MPTNTEQMVQNILAVYAIAGKRAGMAAYQMQAVTWVAWRRLHNIA